MEAPPILLVEDEPDDVRFVQRALKQADLENPLVIAPTVTDAQKLCAAEPPVLVLLDVYLQRRSGLDFLAWLRAQPQPTSDTPVVILSSSMDQTHRSRAQALRASLFLGKPVTEEMLAEAIVAFGLVRTTEVKRGRRRRWLAARDGDGARG
jgi:CheY-like chemotaxis protein